MTSNFTVILPFAIALILGALLPVRTRSAWIFFGVLAIYLVAAAFGYDEFHARTQKTPLEDWSLASFIVLSLTAVAVGAFVSHHLIASSRVAIRFLRGWVGAIAATLVIGCLLSWYFTGDALGWISSPAIPTAFLWAVILLGGALIAAALA